LLGAVRVAVPFAATDVAAGEVAVLLL